MMEDWQMDKLYEEGKMPAWAYFQQRKTNKPLMIILQEQTDPFIKEIEEKRLNRRTQDEQEKELFQQAESIVYEVFEKFLE